MLRVLAVLALVAALLVVSGGTAGACSCAMPTPAERMRESAAVFTATVTQVHVQEPILNGGSVTATLRADHVYKGEARATFEVSTRAQGPACGYTFVEGGRYLVFARAQGSRLNTTMCSGNKQVPAGEQPLRVMGDDLTPELIAALGTPAPVEPTPVKADRTPSFVFALVAAALFFAALIGWRTRRGWGRR